MRVFAAKSIAFSLALVGVLGGGAVMVVIALYLRGGAAMVFTAMHDGHRLATYDRMLAIASFSFGGGLGAGLLLLIFFRLALVRGWMTREQAMDVVNGSRRRKP